MKLLRSPTFSENQMVRGKRTIVMMPESITKIQPQAPKEPVLSAEKNAYKKENKRNAS